MGFSVLISEWLIFEYALFRVVGYNIVVAAIVKCNVVWWFDFFESREEPNIYDVGCKKEPLSYNLGMPRRL